VYAPAQAPLPVAPDDPVQRWLQDVEDKCFEAGRRFEKRARFERALFRRLYHLIITGKNFAKCRIRSALRLT
jgi:hypothetical protein